MQGFITDRELNQAEQVFPGIARFFSTLAVKPRTFLELVAQFDHWCGPAAKASSPRNRDTDVGLAEPVAA